MPTPKQLKENDLTNAQYEALKRSVGTAPFAKDDQNIPRTRHLTDALSMVAATPMIRALQRNGYISLDLVHTTAEISELNTRKQQAVTEARRILNSGNEDKDWLEALGCLQAAASLNKAVSFRRWKLTDKAKQLVAQFNGQ